MVFAAVALAAVAVLVAIVVVSVGHGGELGETHPDYRPLPWPGNRPLEGTDIALVRLPLGVWGYHKQITDEALERAAYALTERDTRIAVLEQQLAEAVRGYEQPHTADTSPARAADTLADAELPPLPGSPVPPGTPSRWAAVETQPGFGYDPGAAGQDEPDSWFSEQEQGTFTPGGQITSADEFRMLSEAVDDQGGAGYALAGLAHDASPEAGEAPAPASAQAGMPQESEPEYDAPPDGEAGDGEARPGAWDGAPQDGELPDHELPDSEVPDSEVPDSEVRDGEAGDGVAADPGAADGEPGSAPELADERAADASDEGVAGAERQKARGT